MPKADFNMLRDHLLDSGVAPRHVVRIISELADHHADLEVEAIRHGLTPDTAAAQATERIGATRTIAFHVLRRPELRCWIHRYPRLARLLLPIAYVALLPIAPVYAGVANARLIARWCACLLLSGIITAAMLLALQISIALS